MQIDSWKPNLLKTYLFSIFCWCSMFIIIHLSACKHKGLLRLSGYFDCREFLKKQAILVVDWLVLLAKARFWLIWYLFEQACFCKANFDIEDFPRNADFGSEDFYRKANLPGGRCVNVLKVVLILLLLFPIPLLVLARHV